jgi:3-deoxy-D-manno-octulosonate 8-phosphate phosphatase (KDO 8-P phosphatase)
VLTDGRLYFGSRGELLQAFHVRDGHGVRAVRRAGIEVAVISGRRSEAVRARCRELGIRYLMQGVEDKLAVFMALRARLKFRPEECACVGDDVMDVPVMSAVGRAYAVADAHPDAHKAAHRSTTAAGGRGAVREVCDELLRARPPRRESSAAARPPKARGRGGKRVGKA